MWIDPDWIRIGIQPKMLDPDEINADPQPWNVLVFLRLVAGDAGAGHVPPVGHEEHQPADAGPQQDHGPAARPRHPREPRDSQPVQQQPGGAPRLPLRHAQAQVGPPLFPTVV